MSNMYDCEEYLSRNNTELTGVRRKTEGLVEKIEG